MLRKGTKIRWHWANGSATGTIEERFTQKVERTLKGATITRNATAKNPAFLIVQDDGTKVLKSRSEIERIKD